MDACRTQVHSPEIRSPEIGTPQICFCQNRFPHAAAGKIAVLKITAGEIRSIQPHARQIIMAEIHLPQGCISPVAAGNMQGCHGTVPEHTAQHFTVHQITGKKPAVLKGTAEQFTLPQHGSGKLTEPEHTPGKPAVFQKSIFEDTGNKPTVFCLDLQKILSGKISALQGFLQEWFHTRAPLFQKQIPDFSISEWAGRYNTNFMNSPGKYMPMG